jgi:hypothetical protein
VVLCGVNVVVKRDNGGMGKETRRIKVLVVWKNKKRGGEVCSATRLKLQKKSGGEKSEINFCRVSGGGKDSPDKALAFIVRNLST